MYRKSIQFNSLADVFNTEMDGPRIELLAFLNKGWLNKSIQFGNKAAMPIIDSTSPVPVHQVGGQSGLMQTTTGVLDTIALMISKGQTPVRVHFEEKAEKAAPLSLGQSMKGNLGGYLSTSSAGGIGTVLALGVGGYLLYKAMNKKR